MTNHRKRDGDFLPLSLTHAHTHARFQDFNTDAGVRRIDENRSILYVETFFLLNFEKFTAYSIVFSHCLPSSRPNRIADDNGADNITATAVWSNIGIFRKNE